VDKGYDYATCRQALKERGIEPRIARRGVGGVEWSERLGRFRWVHTRVNVVVERTMSWLNRFRRLRVRYEQHADTHQAFLSLACALVCVKQLRRLT